jgi:hypothetical protein
MEVWNTLGLQQVLILDQGDNPHLGFTFGALKGIHFIDSLYTRGPTASSCKHPH